jgi:F-type H+-transporting ATPase subunit b
MPQFDPTIIATNLFWLAVTFTILYVLMARVALPRIGEVLEERQARITGDLEKAAELKSESEAVIAAYEKALADARAKAQAVIAEAQKETDAEAARRTAAFDEKVDMMLSDAVTRIDAAKEAAQSEVRSIALDVAGALTQRLDVSVDDKALAGTVDDTLAKRQEAA